VETINFLDFKKNLEWFLDKSYNNHEPIIITRKEGKNMVVISMEDYNSIIETIYLLGNNNNAEHLFKSISQIKK
jgi:antitoxin YefM